METSPVPIPYRVLALDPETCFDWEMQGATRHTDGIRCAAVAVYLAVLERSIPGLDLGHSRVAAGGWPRHVTKTILGRLVQPSSSYDFGSRLD